MAPVRELEIVYYRTEDERVPFSDWLNSLRVAPTRLRIRARLTRVATGNLGDIRSVGGGIFERRIPFGPGYRIYGAQEGKSLVLLLCGGDKSSQRRDIATAKEYYASYRAAKS